MMSAVVSDAVSHANASAVLAMDALNKSAASEKSYRAILSLVCSIRSAKAAAVAAANANGQFLPRQ
jgi:hypothetical protein